MYQLLSIGLLLGAGVFNQQVPKIYNHFATETQSVALTFDDGPDKTNTVKVLDVLKAKQVKACFFVLGENIAGNEAVIKRAYLEGHDIGLHSYSHPNFHKMKYEAIRAEIEKNQLLLYRILGFKPRLIRPPYGIITNDFLKVAQEMNLRIFTWSNDSEDWRTKNDPVTIAKNVFVKLKPGAIVLMHDKTANKANSLKALPAIVDRLKAEGYGFVRLSDATN